MTTRTRLLLQCFLAFAGEGGTSIALERFSKRFPLVIHYKGTPFPDGFQRRRQFIDADLGGLGPLDGGVPLGRQSLHLWA